MLILGDSRPQEVASPLAAAVIDAVPDVVIVADDNARIVMVNQRVGEVFGWTPTELIGRQIDTLLPPRHRAGVLTDGGPITDLHLERQALRGFHKDCTEFPIEVSMVPLEHDQHAYSCVTIRDQTETQRVQNHADQAREDLISSVSHEMRTPLTSIIGYLELVLDNTADLPAQARGMLEVAQLNAHRELSLINDLIAVASAGTEGPGTEIVDLNEIVADCVAQAAASADSRGVVLEWTPAEPTAPVRGRAHRLRQVVDNLVSNALKSTPAGGTVRVLERRVGDQVCVTVADDGIGIPTEELPRIFDRLYRTSAAVEACTPGAGIGLSLVEAIIQAHAGSVKVTSTVGEGSAFQVSLTHAYADATPAAETGRVSGQP